MQRIRAPEAARPAYAEHCNLARYLLEEYAFGGISAHQVQTLALMSNMEGLDNPHVDQLAYLGATGKRTNHIDRDLRVFMLSYLLPVNLPGFNSMSIPLKILKGKDTGIDLIPHHQLRPHKLMHSIYNNISTMS